MSIREWESNPGDRHVVVGCEEGRLQLLDLASSSVIADITAHDEKKRVLALAALPDKTGFISGRYLPPPLLHRPA